MVRTIRYKARDAEGRATFPVCEARMLGESDCSCDECAEYVDELLYEFSIQKDFNWHTSGDDVTIEWVQKGDDTRIISQEDWDVIRNVDFDAHEEYVNGFLRNRHLYERENLPTLVKLKYLEALLDELDEWLKSQRPKKEITYKLVWKDFSETKPWDFKKDCWNLSVLYDAEILLCNEE